MEGYISQKDAYYAVKALKSSDLGDCWEAKYWSDKIDAKKNAPMR
jgi:hypothetical protein